MKKTRQEEQEDGGSDLQELVGIGKDHDPGEIKIRTVCDVLSTTAERREGCDRSERKGAKSGVIGV